MLTLGELWKHLQGREAADASVQQPHQQQQGQSEPSTDATTERLSVAGAVPDVAGRTDLQSEIDSADSLEHGGSIGPAQEWEQHTDPASGMPYYFNLQTRETAWQPSPGTPVVDAPAVDIATDAATAAANGVCFSAFPAVTAPGGADGEQEEGHTPAMDKATGQEEGHTPAMYKATKIASVELGSGTGTASFVAEPASEQPARAILPSDDVNKHRNVAPERASSPVLGADLRARAVSPALSCHWDLASTSAAAATTAAENKPVNLEFNCTLPALASASSSVDPALLMRSQHSPPQTMTTSPTIAATTDSATLETAPPSSALRFSSIPVSTGMSAEAITSSKASTAVAAHETSEEVSVLSMFGSNSLSGLVSAGGMREEAESQPTPRRRKLPPRRAFRAAVLATLAVPPRRRKTVSSVLGSNAVADNSPTGATGDSGPGSVGGGADSATTAAVPESLRGDVVGGASVEAADAVDGVGSSVGDRNRAVGPNTQAPESLQPGTQRPLPSQRGTLARPGPGDVALPLPHASAHGLGPAGGGRLLTRKRMAVGEGAGRGLAEDGAADAFDDFGSSSDFGNSPTPISPAAVGAAFGELGASAPAPAAAAAAVAVDGFGDFNDTSEVADESSSADAFAAFDDFGGSSSCPGPNASGGGNFGHDFGGFGENESAGPASVPATAAGGVDDFMDFKGTAEVAPAGLAPADSLDAFGDLSAPTSPAAAGGADFGDHFRASEPVPAPAATASGGNDEIMNFGSTDKAEVAPSEASPAAASADTCDDFGGCPAAPNPAATDAGGGADFVDDFGGFRLTEPAPAALLAAAAAAVSGGQADDFMELGGTLESVEVTAGAAGADVSDGALSGGADFGDDFGTSEPAARRNTTLPAQTGNVGGGTEAPAALVASAAASAVLHSMSSDLRGGATGPDAFGGAVAAGVLTESPAVLAASDMSVSATADETRESGIGEARADIDGEECVVGLSTVVEASPPPGLTKIQEMAWKKEQRAGPVGAAAEETAGAAERGRGHAMASGYESLEGAGAEFSAGTPLLRRLKEKDQSKERTNASMACTVLPPGAPPLPHTAPGSGAGTNVVRRKREPHPHDSTPTTADPKTPADLSENDLPYEPSVYRSIKKGVIRSGIDKDSGKVGDLEEGETFVALQAELLGGYLLRLRFDRGWTSFRSGTGKQLLSLESGQNLHSDTDAKATVEKKAAQADTLRRSQEAEKLEAKKLKAEKEALQAAAKLQREEDKTANAMAGKAKRDAEVKAKKDAEDADRRMTLGLPVAATDNECVAKELEFAEKTKANDRRKIEMEKQLKAQAALEKAKENDRMVKIKAMEKDAKVKAAAAEKAEKQRVKKKRAEEAARLKDEKTKAKKEADEVKAKAKTDAEQAARRKRIGLDVAATDEECIAREKQLADEEAAAKAAAVVEKERLKKQKEEEKVAIAQAKKDREDAISAEKKAAADQLADAAAEAKAIANKEALAKKLAADKKAEAELNQKAEALLATLPPVELPSGWPDGVPAVDFEADCKLTKGAFEALPEWKKSNVRTRAKTALGLREAKMIAAAEELAAAEAAAKIRSEDEAAAGHESAADEIGERLASKGPDGLATFSPARLKKTAARCGMLRQEFVVLGQTGTWKKYVFVLWPGVPVKRVPKGERYVIRYTEKEAQELGPMDPANGQVTQTSLPHSNLTSGLWSTSTSSTSKDRPVANCNCAGDAIVDCKPRHRHHFEI